MIRTGRGVALNHVYCENNLPFMESLPDESIDLIYLDPPFMTGRSFGKFNDKWPSKESFFEYMDERLFHCHRLLKSTGSLYLHCDWRTNYRFRHILNETFGEDNFMNEIVWRIGWVSGFKTQKKGWIRNHDTILYYCKTKEAAKRFNKEYIPYPEGYTRRDGKPPTGKGIPTEDTWNCSEGDILDSIMIKSFAKKTGWPTEKPIALLERIIKASSNEGDLVADFFCGSGTTLVAAKKLGRDYLGCDLSEDAVKITRERMDGLILTIS